MDALEYEGQTYMAFFPAVEDEADEESEDYGLVILKSVMENSEEPVSYTHLDVYKRQPLASLKGAASFLRQKRKNA